MQLPMTRKCDSEGMGFLERPAVHRVTASCFHYSPSVSPGDPALPRAAVGNESWFVGESRAPGNSPGVGPPTRGTLPELEEDLARNFAGHPAVSLSVGVASGCASLLSLQLRPRWCKFVALRVGHHCV